MKKLMFAAAVAAGMGAFALESANVVGFQDIKTSKDGAGAEFFKYTFVGMTFENIDANGYFKLGDVKAEGMVAPGEYLYQLTTDRGTPNNSTAITYMSLENALTYWGDGEWYTEETLKPYVGWYSLPLPQYPDWVQEGEGALVNDTLDWKAGEGYLGNFKGDHKLIFNFPKAY